VWGKKKKVTCINTGSKHVLNYSRKYRVFCDIGKPHTSRESALSAEKSRRCWSSAHCNTGWVDSASWVRLSAAAEAGTSSCSVRLPPTLQIALVHYDSVFSLFDAAFGRFLSARRGVLRNATFSHRWVGIRARQITYIAHAIPAGRQNIFSSYFTKNSDLHTYNPRSKNEPHFQLFTTSLGQRSIKFKGCQLWCCLPDELRSVSSTSVFKTKLKQFLQTL